MADWLEASGCIKHLTPEEMRWWKAQEYLGLFATIVSACDVMASELESEFNEYVAEFGEFHLTINYVPQDELVDLVQDFFKRFRPHECVTITWACESGSYLGGGACLISATDDKWIHTGNWAKEQEEQFYGRKSQ